MTQTKITVGMTELNCGTSGSVQTENARKVGEVGMVDRESVAQALKDSLRNQHCGFIEGVGNVYAVSEETINDTLKLLKEQEAMVKPTKCPCGELFDAKDSSFCPKCGCAYGELSGRYTNIGR